MKNTVTRLCITSSHIDILGHRRVNKEPVKWPRAFQWTKGALCPYILKKTDSKDMAWC
jgi:hypothetical protein